MSGTAKRFGNFTLIRRLAVGGMAEVYLARQEGVAGFAKHVVIKRIHSHLNRDPEFVSMFLDEARLVARLSHPNIASVHDFGLEDGTHYLVMEHVHGVALSSAIKRSGGIEATHALRIASEMAAGLNYAHGLKDDQTGEPLGIVHRDVSPQNVLLSYDGSVKLIDFGVAKARTQAHETRAGAFKGKYAYMAPEQARGKGFDHRADQHAVGIVLWEMLTGRGLFHRSSQFDSMQAVLSQQPASVRARHPELPPEIDEVLGRCLAKEPESRYESCGALQADLDELAASAGLLSSSARLGQYVRDLFEVQSSTGEFRDDALRVATDVSTMPGGPPRAGSGEDDAPKTDEHSHPPIETLEDALEEDTAEEKVSPAVVALAASSAVARREEPRASSSTPPVLPEGRDHAGREASGPPPAPAPVGTAGEAGHAASSPAWAVAAEEERGPAGRRRTGPAGWAILGLVGVVIGVGVGFATWRVVHAPPTTPRGAGPTGGAGLDATSSRGGRSEEADAVAALALPEPAAGDASSAEGGSEERGAEGPGLAAGRDGAAGTLGPAPAEELVAGFLTVTSEPTGAMIWVDGQQIGERTSARDLPLDPGPHAVELTLEGFRRWRQRVEVAAGENLRLRARLVAEGGAGAARDGGAGVPRPQPDSGPVDYGVLSIESTPPARVRLGGRELGPTPIAGEEVPAGTHRLTLVTEDGRSFVRTVSVEAGRTTRQSYDLSETGPRTPVPAPEGPDETSPER